MRVKFSISAALALAGCAPDGPLANAASDIENASDAYGNRTDNTMDRIGNRMTPVIERTIDRVDGNTEANAAESPDPRRD